MSREVICIIGMHRSGTSMVARLLRDAGLYLGPDDLLLGANSGNPDGHFEHTGFLEINDALLRHLGGAWDTPPSLEPGWESDASLDDFRAKAKTLVATFPGDTSWGWKEPRTSVLLPFWKSIITNLRFVICVRNPLDVARSLATRNQLAVDHGAHLWNRYMRSAIQDTEGFPRCLVFYEDFFQGDTTGTRQLLKFCGLDSTESLMWLGDGIRSDLRHHQAVISELLEESSVLEYPKILYLGLRALSVCEPTAKAPKGASSDGISRFFKLLEAFCNQDQVGRLNAALAEKNHLLSNLRVENEREISTLRQQLEILQERVDRLQRFSDAVRRSVAYRAYRWIIRPLMTAWRGAGYGASRPNGESR